MPTNLESDELLNELIDLLIYDNYDIEEWKRLVGREMASPEHTLGALGQITRAGFSAEVSKSLAHFVALRYAKSESSTMSSEEIATLVEQTYESQRQKKEDAEKRAEGGK